MTRRAAIMAASLLICSSSSLRFREGGRRGGGIIAAARLDGARWAPYVGAIRGVRGQINGWMGAAKRTGGSKGVVSALACPRLTDRDYVYVWR